MSYLHRVQGPFLGPNGTRVFATLDVAPPVIRSLHLHTELATGDVSPLVAMFEPVSPSRPGIAPESLPGSICVPAFVDGHTHLVGMGLGKTRPDLSSAQSKDEALALLEGWLRDHPGSSPVIAEGWDQSRWGGTGGLTGTDLDRLDASRPIAARRVCGHIATFNRAALGSLGDWPGLDRAEGVATEELPLSLSRLWPPTEEELDVAVLRGQEQAIRHGIGWVQEMGDRTTWQAFRRAEERGALKIRVSHYFRCEGAEARRELGQFAAERLGADRSGTYRDGDRLRFAGIKLFLDGSLGARTAALREPYPREGGHGRLLWEDEALTEAIEICVAQDWPIAVHAIGDGAIEQLLRVLEETGVPGGIGPRIEHAEMMSPELLERADALGAFLSMQPNFTDNWQGHGGLYDQVLGPERARKLNPYRDAERSGRLLFGSDTMPIGPARGVRGALGHPDPSQRLDSRVAFRAYSERPAAAVRSPFHTATLKAGEPANLVLLTPDSGPDGHEVVATVLDGELCYGPWRLES